MKKIVAIIMLAFVVTNINAQKLRLALLPPMSEGYYVASEAQKDVMLGALEEAFTKAGVYIVLDRTTLEKIWKELTFTSDGRFDEASIEKIGNWQGANIVCIPKITKSNEYHNDMVITFSLKKVEDATILRTVSDAGIISNTQELRQMCRNLAKKIAFDIDEKNVTFGPQRGDKIIECYGNKFEIIQPEDKWCRATKQGDNKIKIECDKTNNIETRETTLKLELSDERRIVDVTITQEQTKSVVDVDEVTFKENGGEEKRKVLVNNEFKLPTTIPDWLKVTTNGKEITIKCLPNKEGERDYKMILVFSGKSTNWTFPIDINQRQKDIIPSGYKDIKVPASSGKIEVPVNTGGNEDINVDFEGNNNGLYKDFHYKKKENVLIINYNKNTQPDERSVELKVEAGNNREDIITITQEGKTIHQNIFALKNQSRDWGFSVGYVQRGWNLCVDKNQELSSWEQPEAIPGVQAGLKFNTFFAPHTFGLGMDYGFYYEYASANKTAMNPAEREYSYDFQKHTVYIPVHLIYKYDFINNLGIFVYGGVGLDFGIYEKIKTTYTGETTPFYQSPDEINFSSIMNRFSVSTEFGGGIQFFKFMISTTITNRVFSPEEVYAKKQKQGIMVNLSLMF